MAACQTAPALGRSERTGLAVFHDFECLRCGLCFEEWSENGRKMPCPRCASAQTRIVFLSPPGRLGDKTRFTDRMLERTAREHSLSDIQTDPSRKHEKSYDPKSEKILTRMLTERGARMTPDEFMGMGNTYAWASPEVYKQAGMLDRVIKGDIKPKALPRAMLHPNEAHTQMIMPEDQPAPGQPRRVGRGSRK